MAGCESDGWRPLIADFVLLAQKLEKLGFIYNKGDIIAIDQYEEGFGNV